MRPPIPKMVSTTMFCVCCEHFGDRIEQHAGSAAIHNLKDSIP